MLSKYKDLVEQVNFLNIYKARTTVYQYLKKTHLIHYSSLSEMTGADIDVKHENHNPTGSFKIRGTVNFMAHVSNEVREKGIIVATRGNHGLAAAWAARNEKIFCNVAVPINNNPEINNSIIGLGAELMQHGRDFYETQEYCEEIADEMGYYYLEQGNEPGLLNGIGTMGLEIFEDLPDADIIIIPVGGGGGCASLIRVAQAINPGVRIIGVIAEKAPSLKLSLEKGELVTTDSADTFADGLAARSVFEVPYHVIRDSSIEVVTVSEEEIVQGVLLSLTHTHNLAEGAGAAGISCALKIKDKIAGKKVVIVMTGANLDRIHLERALNR